MRHFWSYAVFVLLIFNSTIIYGFEENNANQSKSGSLILVPHNYNLLKESNKDSILSKKKQPLSKYDKYAKTSKWLGLSSIFIGLLGSFITTFGASLLIAGLVGLVGISFGLAAIKKSSLKKEYRLGLILSSLSILGFIAFILFVFYLLLTLDLSDF